MKVKNIWKILEENKEIIGIVMILGGGCSFALGAFESMILISAGMISIIVYSVLSKKIGSFKTTIIFIVFLIIFVVVLKTIYDKIDCRLAVSLLLVIYLVMIVILVIRIKEKIIQAREKRRQKITNKG